MIKILHYFLRFGLSLLFPAALLMFAAGCSRSSYEEREAAFTRVPTPQVPAFLNGPIAVLLTNTPGFSAQVKMENPATPKKDQRGSGQLLGRGAELLFVPEATQAGEKPSRGGGFSFIWNVASASGYVLCEPLQGYAPISSSVQVTNVIWQPRPAATEKLAGRLCSVAVGVFQLNDGTSASFEVCRAPELQNLPLRIVALTNANALTLTLAKPRLEPVAPDQFSPPAGFTRYTSIEALADELAARQRLQLHGNRGALEQDFERMNPQPPPAR
jgi:hypothetical protein